MEESNRTYHFESAANPQFRRKRITRKISRTLSLVVTRVPSLLNVAKFKELGSRDNLTLRADKKPRHRTIDVTLIVPDKTQRNVLGRSPQTIQRLIQTILDEFQLDPDSCSLRLAGSKASVDPLADVALLEGDVLVIEASGKSNQGGPDDDACYKSTEQFLHRELCYITDLQSSTELYGIPLRRLDYLSDTEYELLFEPLCQLADVCAGVAQQISNVLADWSNEEGKIGAIFSSEFWDQYEKYQEMHRQARELLREKNQDEEFVELCRHRRGAAQYTLESILQLPVQRLAQYELYFQSLLHESRQLHEYETQQLIAAKTRANQAVRRGQDESDLERIQDLFPNDCLYLYDKEVVTMKMKGLMRKRSGTASRLQRALSAKSLRHENSPPRTPAPGTDTRTFLMEAPVQFCTGVQSQERHLFLFNDLLLVAKARSGGNFKLKEKVRVSELWLSKGCMDEVTELSKSPDTCFSLGWPTTNVVAVFSTQASRDLWWTKLSEVLVTERLKEPPSTNIQVIYYDHNTNIEYCKTFMVGPEETAKGCIKAALAQLGLDGGQFQLWVKTARDEAPYPLIGHERPFAIKLSCLRDGLAAEEGFDLDHCNNVHDPLARCHFILRNSASSKSLEDTKKTSKKSGRISLGQVFRRSLTKENPGCLFGLPLARIMEGDNIPKPVAAMLLQIFTKGPFTQGIFRKSANARLVRELKEKLDLGEEVSFEHVPVLVTAALLKEFLRSLPDPLLTSALYPQYRAALNSPNTHHKLLRLKGVLQQLPKTNFILLSHFLCVLHHISRRSAHNLMSSSNLGVCVGPSLIWGAHPSLAEDLRLMPALVECLITNCEVLLGPHVSHLLGDPRDSGTEESDSLRRDDSSIDSLECSPPPRKDKISLSRDSGLTMSDSQLYTPDEEESGSTSSSGYDPPQPHPHPRAHYDVTPSLSMPPPGEYVRVYGGWEERLNPNFSRQAWFRQRSRRINSKPDHQVARCASEESLLDNPPPTPPRRNKPHATPPTPLTPKSSFVLSKYSTPLTPQNTSSPPYDLYVNTPSNSYSSTDLYQPVFTPSHPPLRKVTAVHCEVVPDPSRAGEGEGGEDSSTLSDDDCTPHVSRSNSRGNEVRLRHLPPVHVEGGYVRGRLKRKEERAAHRSRSLPPPPPYRPPPPASTLRYNIARAYMDEESYV